MIPRSQPSNIIRPRLILPAGLPSPAEMGLPDKFQSWRPAQWHGIETITEAKTRFIGICAPTGIGKALLGVSAAYLTGRRSVVLTSTLGLADQYHEDFAQVTRDVRGMANYPCVAASELKLDENTNVSTAPCQMGYQCALRKYGCLYYDNYRDAQREPIITTTFQAWFYDTLKSRDALHTAPWEVDDPTDAVLRPQVDMLIADEAHEAAEELSRYLGVNISQRECLQLGIDWMGADHSIEEWRAWAEQQHKDMTTRIKGWEDRFRNGGGNGVGWSRELKHLRDMLRKVDRLATMKEQDDWIKGWEDNDHYRAVKFTPLDPARYAERALWRGVKKVVLMSATIRPKTAELLGIPHDDMTFVEYPSAFPVERRPIISIPSVMLNHRTERDDRLMRKWLDRMDAVIETRLDRKGIIHGVSYVRSKFIKDNSRFGEYMYVHNSSNRAEVIEHFRQREAPAILVSPSVDTGYDFPMDQCLWMIIAKIPFASIADKLVQARQQRDKEYGLFLTAQTLVQMCGRGMRSAEDWLEVIILDDAFGNWFFRRAKKFFPAWWVDALVWADAPPLPMKISE